MNRTTSSPPREFPPPPLVSKEAAASITAPRPKGVPLPPIEDRPAWRAWIAAIDAVGVQTFGDAARKLPATAQAAEIAGVPVYTAVPDTLSADMRDKVLMFLHPGALALWGGECVKYFAIIEAARSACPVVAVDYRNAPDHPYPEGLDDCVAVYRELVKRHGAARIAVSGASGGGNLAAALALRARDENIPLPSSLVLLTPHLDLTESGDTWTTNVGLDSALEGSARPFNVLYATSHDMKDPYLSPLFADLSRGFPPTLLQTGTRDLLLSTTVLMHRALRKHDLPAELHVWEAMSHGGFGGAPEDDDVRQEINRFIRKHWQRA